MNKMCASDATLDEYHLRDLKREEKAMNFTKSLRVSP